MNLSVRGTDPAHAPAELLLPNSHCESSAVLLRSHVGYRSLWSTWFSLLSLPPEPPAYYCPDNAQPRRKVWCSGNSSTGCAQGWRKRQCVTETAEAKVEKTWSWPMRALLVRLQTKDSWRLNLRPLCNNPVPHHVSWLKIKTWFIVIHDFRR